MHDTTMENAPNSTNWKKVVYIVQEEFFNGTLAEESTCQTVVLIPKGASGDFRGIGLVKVIWKAVTSLMNRRIVEAIKFHYVLQGFWAGRETGTDIIEVNMLQHITSMR